VAEKSTIGKRIGSTATIKMKKKIYIKWYKKDITERISHQICPNPKMKQKIFPTN